jgi:NAD(P)-dependent dehydrogenase (short-subunit alcohol dehydrogenase family)
MARTYVVTGAASGIGAATAAMLRSRGETVIGVDLIGVEVESDITSAAGRTQAAAAATEAAGGVVDAVIACAGIAHPIAKTISVNFFGMTEFLTAMLPALGASQAPRAALISSMASLQPNSAELVEACLNGDEAGALAIAGPLEESGPQAGGALIYGSSKRAISRWVRREAITPAWAGAGIPLNAVGPGIVVTPMTADLLATPDMVAFVDQAVPMPLNYHQPPESVAALLIWLTSVENTHMAGQTVYVDGGSDAVLRGDDIWSCNDNWGQ